MNYRENIKHYIRNNRGSFDLMSPEQRRVLVRNAAHLVHLANVQKVTNESKAIFARYYA